MRTDAQLLACALALLATPADACGKGPFTVETWNVEPARDGFVRLTAELRLKAEHSVRMVEGEIWFSDALGRLIGGIPLDPDLAMVPSQLTQAAGHQPAGRFLTVDHADMHVEPCVRAVIYEDGSVERF